MTAAPSRSASGGASTTRSPARTPLRTWRSAPNVWPSVTRRALHLAVGVDEHDALVAVRAHRLGRHAARPAGGAAVPGAGGGSGLEEGHAHAHVRHDARDRVCLSAMRTFTVALLRSAVGMIAITSAGSFESG